MNAIRAMSGVPLDFHGTAQGICADYWSQVVDAMESALGDDAKPWPSASARAALEGGDDADQPNEALKALYARGKAMRADEARDRKGEE